jgi:hypothetical protein
VIAADTAMTALTPLRDSIGPSTGGAAAWLPATLLLIVSVAMSGWLALRPVAGEPTLVWFPPGVSADRALDAAARADALIIDRGPVPTSLVVQPDARNGIVRLRAAGAWLVVNARFFGCQSPMGGDER